MPLKYFSPVSYYTRNAVFKDGGAKIFKSIDFFLILRRSDNELLVSEIEKKKWGSLTSFQR